MLCNTPCLTQFIAFFQFNYALYSYNMFTKWPRSNKYMVNYKTKFVTLFKIKDYII